MEYGDRSWYWEWQFKMFIQHWWKRISSFCWWDLSNELVIEYCFPLALIVLFSFTKKLSNIFVFSGLVDTAVKTAETGYMQRRLVKVREAFFSGVCSWRSSMEGAQRKLWCERTIKARRLEREVSLFPVSSRFFPFLLLSFTRIASYFAPLSIGWAPETSYVFSKGLAFSLINSYKKIKVKCFMGLWVHTLN